jgi:ferredoxin-NADP reductase
MADGIRWWTGEVTATVRETARAVTIALAVPGWPSHRPGQHVDVRLTAADGYQAARSYSIANPPEANGVAITVERLEDGEVSPYLVDEVRPGDRLDLRGPIGGHFVWEVALGGPLLLVAGGSGIVPLMAMLRHRAAVGSAVPVTLLYSSRSWEDVFYRDELAALVSGDPEVRVVHTLTRSRPPGWEGYTRRVDAAMLAGIAPVAAPNALAYVCGPTPFVERVAGDLVELGLPPGRVRTERFGPTGRPIDDEGGA